MDMVLPILESIDQVLLSDYTNLLGWSPVGEKQGVLHSEVS